MIILYTSLAIAFLALICFEYDKRKRIAMENKRKGYFTGDKKFKR